MWHSNFIDTKFGKLHYIEGGKGTESLVMFPGFGMSARTMAFFISPELLKNYYIIVIDIFGHGESKLPKNCSINPEQWIEIYHQLVEKHSILKQKTNILGLSLGSRYALTTVLKSDNIKSLTLLAPDGIINRKVFEWATSSDVFANFYQNYAHKIIGIAKPFMNEKLYKRYANKTVFMRMIREWRFVKNLHVHPKQITTAINEKNIKTTLYTADRDIISLIETNKHFIRKIEQGEIIHTNYGHFQIQKLLQNIKIA